MGTVVAPDGGTVAIRPEFFLMLLLFGMCNLVTLWAFSTMHPTF